MLYQLSYARIFPEASAGRRACLPCDTTQIRRFFPLPSSGLHPRSCYTARTWSTAALRVNPGSSARGANPLRRISFAGTATRSGYGGGPYAASKPASRPIRTQKPPLSGRLRFPSTCSKPFSFVPPIQAPLGASIERSERCRRSRMRRPGRRFGTYCHLPTILANRFDLACLSSDAYSDRICSTSSFRYPCLVTTYSLLLSLP